MKKVKIYIFLMALIALVYCFGCASGNYKKLTDEKYKVKPKGYDLEVFVNKVESPHKVIAVVQSKSYDNKYELTKTKQVEQIKKVAKKIGADAVQNIHLLENKAHGYVIDYHVPFLSFKQDKYKLYFLRGEAIIYRK